MLESRKESQDGKLTYNQMQKHKGTAEVRYIHMGFLNTGKTGFPGMK